MILGVTGGIAAGKSTVVTEFARLGAEVVCADQLAREVVALGQPLLKQLADRFGAEILTAEGELDRPRLAQRIFAQENERLSLNALMHPAIAQLADTRIAQAQALSPPLVVYDAALLYEAGAEGQVDAVLVVTADEVIRAQRLMERNQIGEREARRRIAAQTDVKAAIERADYRIDNSGSRQETLRQVRRLFSALTGAPDGGETSG